MNRSIKEIIWGNVRNIPGWHSKRHIIVFESDDWGSIRMPSLTIRNKLESLGLDFHNQPFNLYDSLESNDDLSSLLDILIKHKDYNGNHPVITALTIVGNPNFEKIKESGYENYFWEPFPETLKQYPKHDQVYKLYREGITQRLFIPEFHGREHLHVNRWLILLKGGNPTLQIGFDHRLTGLSTDLDGRFIGHMQAAFDMDTESDLVFMSRAISEGITEFEKLFGYKARYFAPTNGPFNNKLENDLEKGEIDYILTGRVQKEPQGKGVYKKHYHYLGQKNKNDQTYLTRNSFFEPSLYANSFEQCLHGIADAFRWGKPAIISTHRVNYIGYIDPDNRDMNLKLLDKLLATILKRWPDVEFMTSSTLGDLISGKQTRR